MKTVAIGAIKVSNSRRSLRDVSELAESIRAVGLLNPITVTHEYHLIAGYHRLEACKLLGWAEVPVNVLTLNATDAELAEIDENLIRHELSVLERGEHLLRRKQLYEAKYPETRKGVAGGKARHGSATEIVSFAEDTAARMNVTPRTIRQEVQIAESLPVEVRDLIRGTEYADSKTDLLAFMKLNPTDQLYIAQRVRVHEKVATFCETFLVLEVIRDKALYQGEYATFDDFFNTEVGQPNNVTNAFNVLLEAAREMADLFTELPSHSMNNSRTKHLRETRFFWSNKAAA